MPRNFFSSAQFQRKRKSLVFFQSINFLWPSISIITVHFIVIQLHMSTKISPIWLSYIRRLCPLKPPFSCSLSIHLSDVLSTLVCFYLFSYE
jgi:hypothetical protein